MKLTDKITKKVQKQIDYLNFGLQFPTWQELFYYLMDKEKFYVMAIPITKDKWEVSIVGLDRPNKLDGLLNKFDLVGTQQSYEASIRYGIEELINELYKGKRTYIKKCFDTDYMKNLEEKMKKEGFI